MGCVGNVYRGAKFILEEREFLASVELLLHPPQYSPRL
jgi:hypothetical protein